MLVNNIFHPSDIYSLGELTSFTRLAVTAGKLETVKLLVEYGGLLIEDDISKDNDISTAMLARKLGHIDIAEYLEETIKKRCHQLKAQIVSFQYKCQLFRFGLFADTKSNLHTDFGNHIGDEMIKKMISFERKM